MNTGSLSPAAAAALPRVSVVIAVRNGIDDLRACLTAIRSSTLAVHELIVIDDASTVDVASVAKAFGATVTSLPVNRGPAYARNRGAELASGEILFFTDADVRVHPQTIEIAARTLAADAALAAVIGSYDETPADPHFIAQYKNLFHHWVHQAAKPEAKTFWTGCGAIRRRVFLAVGGFNEGYRKPSIEDIELGFRLHGRGERIRLEKSMLATHAKRWQLYDLIRTDVFLRGVPWIALMLRDRHDPKDLNLSFRSKLATLVAGSFVLSLLLVAILAGPAAALPALALLGATGLVSTWGGRRGALPVAGALALPILATSLAAAFAPAPWALLPVGLLVALASSHFDLYEFFARKRGVAFAVAVLPMHLIFQLCCAASVPLGWLRHARDQRRAEHSQEGPAIRELPPLPRTAQVQRSLGA
jgi:glycosyltransferase involved in cell wall biosynthesis